MDAKCDGQTDRHGHFDWKKESAKRADSSKTHLQRCRPTTSYPITWFFLYKMSPKQLKPGIIISLITDDLCLPRTKWECSDIQYFRSSQHIPGMIICPVYLPVPGCVGLPKKGLWKHVAGSAAANRSQEFHRGICTVMYLYGKHSPGCISEDNCFIKSSALKILSLLCKSNWTMNLSRPR